MKDSKSLNLLGILGLSLFLMFTSAVRADSQAMVGCNLSGGDFGSNVPGVLGTDYFYPSVSHYDWCKSQGMSLVRIPFKWERVQYQDASGTGALNNFLNTPDITAIDNSLNLAESRGVRYLLDMHNYAARQLTIGGTAATYTIGTAQLPIAAYANAWSLLAQHFAGRTALWGYDIMNEPHGLPNGVTNWQAMAQAAVNAIRQVDMVHPIIVEGYFYAQASSWTTNGAPLIGITDPANNLIFSAHSYTDEDGSGTWSHGGTVQAELVSSGKYPSVPAAYQVGVDRVTPFVNWCVTNNVRCLVGEFGSPMAIDTANWDIILDNFMNYIKTTGNGLISTTQWGGGAWSNTYVVRMENRKDNSNPPPVASVDSKYVTDSGSNWWFPFTWYHNTISVTADYSYGYSFASTSPAATCTFNTADTSTHYPGGTTTQSADLNYSIPAGGNAGAGMHIRGPLSAGAVGGVDTSRNLKANHVLSFWAVTSTPGASPSVTLGTTADSNGIDTGADTGTGNWISLSNIAPLTTSWQHYQIPLSQIMNSSISGQPLQRLRISAGPADSNTYDVHFDQVTIQTASNETAPTVSLTTADGGSSYSTGQDLTLAASPAVSNPDNAVAYVEFYTNGQSIGVATAAPYQVTTSFSNAGPYNATAIVWDGHGVSTQSSPVALTITPSGSAPASPTGLTATVVSSSSINLTWAGSGSATSYNILRSTTSGGPYTIASTGVIPTSYSDTGLSATTTYYYVVQAVNGDGTSPNSNMASATTQSGIPLAPTGLTATATSGNSINLAWNGSSGATSYNILRSTTSGGPYTTVMTGLSSTAYSDTGLSAGTAYYYVVQAVTGAGASQNSNEASATTQVEVSLALSEQDIGSFAPAGSASYSGGVYTVNTGNGSELMTSSTTDKFSYDTQSVSGDFDLTARVTGMNCSDAAKCEGAVMIRETLANSSTYAAAGVTDGRGTQFNYRTATGSTSASTAGPVKYAPYWVRVTRVGNKFTSYSSADGNIWTQLGSPQTITMATSVYCGLAVANHGAGGTVTFDNVSLTGVPPVLTITAQNQSIVYGSSIPTLTSTISGFVNGDTAAVITGAPVLSTTATSTSPVGTYQISVAVGTLTVPNYALAVTDGVLSITPIASTTALSLSSQQAASGSPDTLTATVTSAAGAPSGTIAFTSGAATLCSATVNASGAANCSFVSSVLGAMTITATYSGDANHQASSGVAVLTVYDPSVQLQLVGTQLVYPGATNVTACAVGTTSATATGSVQIYDGTLLLTTQPLQGGGCAYWYISPGMAAGTHSLIAIYSGDANNQAGSSAAVAVVVSPVPVNMSVACWNSSFTYGGNYQCTVNASSNAGAAQGVITYMSDGGTPIPADLSNGNAQFTIPEPAVGTHAVVIMYAQQTNYAAATSQTETFTVTAAP
jgi:regulation of enolase protein 1 (concanavalin A-like superfamily)